MFRECYSSYLPSGGTTCHHGVLTKVFLNPELAIVPIEVNDYIVESYRIVTIVTNSVTRRTIKHRL